MTERTDSGGGLGTGPPPSAQIEVILRSGDTVVRRFVRYCPEDTGKHPPDHRRTRWAGCKPGAANCRTTSGTLDARAQEREVAA